MVISCQFDVIIAYCIVITGSIKARDIKSRWTIFNLIKLKGSGDLILDKNSTTIEPIVLECYLRCP